MDNINARFGSFVGGLIIAVASAVAFVLFLVFLFMLMPVLYVVFKAIDRDWEGF